MKAPYHIAGIALGLSIYTIGELMCWILGSTDNLFPFTRNIIVFFLNYFVFFGIFGLSLLIMLYCTTKHGEQVTSKLLSGKYKVIMYAMYIVFALLVPVYIVFRMLFVVFDLHYTVEVASVLYIMMIMVFSFVRGRIFA